MEQSNIQVYALNPTITSGRNQAFGGACVGFWYHMWGENLGSLRLLSLDDNLAETEVWKKEVVEDCKETFYLQYMYLHNYSDIN